MKFLHALFPSFYGFPFISNNFHLIINLKNIVPFFRNNEILKESVNRVTVKYHDLFFSNIVLFTCVQICTQTIIGSVTPKSRSKTSAKEKWLYFRSFVSFSLLQCAIYLNRYVSSFVKTNILLLLFNIISIKLKFETIN